MNITFILKQNKKKEILISHIYIYFFLHKALKKKISLWRDSNSRPLVY